MNHFGAQIIFLLSFIAFCLSLAGCQQRKWELTAKSLITKQQQLEQRHQQIRVSIDSLWDHTTAMIAERLPEDIPPVDRQIFLESRNADHMKMFMSFDSLDADVQSIIHQAGEYDQHLAGKMHELMQDRQAFEKEKLQLLSVLERQGVPKDHSLYAQLRTF